MSHNLTPPDDDYIPPELIGVTHISPELFEQVCRNHRKLRLELTSTGELIVMPPIGAQSSRCNANLISQLVEWSQTDGSGDELPTLLGRMEEYIGNGISLGWLIDPYKRRVYIYEPDHELLILENPETVSGEPLLRGFTLNVAELW